jgi:hypothetical protein
MLEVSPKLLWECRMVLRLGMLTLELWLHGWRWVWRVSPLRWAAPQHQCPWNRHQFITHPWAVRAVAVGGSAAHVVTKVMELRMKSCAEHSYVDLINLLVHECQLRRPWQVPAAESQNWLAGDAIGCWGGLLPHDFPPGLSVFLMTLTLFCCSPLPLHLFGGMLISILLLLLQRKSSR